MNRFEMFNIPIILDRFTRINYLSNFPMKKYTTFYHCLAEFLPELPMDVVKYIMSMMIDTDKIHLRLSVMEAMLLHLNVNQLNIEFPNCSLDFNEMHEAMLIKLYMLSCHPKLSYEYLPSYDYKCTLCNYHGDIKINDVIICIRCYQRIRYFKAKEIIQDYPVLKTVNDENFKELKQITYFKYLTYNTNYELSFVSKKLQAETKNLKIHLKQLITQETILQEKYETLNTRYHDFLLCKQWDDNSYKSYDKICQLNCKLICVSLYIKKSNDKIDNLKEALKNLKNKTNILKSICFEYIKWINHKNNNILKEQKKLQKTLYNQHVNQVKMPKNKRSKVNIYGKR